MPKCACEKAVSDPVVSFLSALENSDVINKLREIISISFELTFDKKLILINKKLDDMHDKIKSISSRISVLENINKDFVQENKKLIIWI